jgi:putative exporter of polyketide antibiotics
MVDYPNLSSLNSNSGIGGLLAFPNAIDPLFWTVILTGIFSVLTLTMYFREKSLTGRGNLLSSAAVSSLACIMLAVLGSLLEIFTVETLVPIAVFGILIIVVWIFSNKN